MHKCGVANLRACTTAQLPESITANMHECVEAYERKSTRA